MNNAKRLATLGLLGIVGCGSGSEHINNRTTSDVSIQESSAQQNESFAIIGFADDAKLGSTFLYPSAEAASAEQRVGRYDIKRYTLKSDGRAVVNRPGKTGMDGVQIAPSLANVPVSIVTTSGLRSDNYQIESITETNSCDASNPNLQPIKFLFNRASNYNEILTLKNDYADQLKSSGYVLGVSPFLGCLYVERPAPNAKEVFHLSSATGSHLYTKRAEERDYLVGLNVGWKVEASLGYYLPENDANVVFLSSLFSKYIGRAPSDGEFAFHLNRLQANQVTKVALESEFINCSEGTAYANGKGKIIAVYKQTLGRSPKSSELTSYLARLSNGSLTVAGMEQELKGSRRGLIYQLAKIQVDGSVIANTRGNTARCFVASEQPQRKDFVLQLVADALEYSPISIPNVPVGALVTPNCR